MGNGWATLYQNMWITRPKWKRLAGTQQTEDIHTTYMYYIHPSFIFLYPIVSRYYLIRWDNSSPNSFCWSLLTSDFSCSLLAVLIWLFGMWIGLSLANLSLKNKQAWFLRTCIFTHLYNAKVTMSISIKCMILEYSRT